MSFKKPKFLHKFCTVDRAIQILTENSIFLASPKSFNDPFEISPIIDYAFNNEDRYKILEQLSERGLNFTNEELIDKSKNQGYDYIITIEVDGFIDYIYNFSGITCFCKTFDNMALWNHYGDSHKGVCLVFNNLKGDNPIHIDALPVLYTNEHLPIKSRDYFLDYKSFLRTLKISALTKRKEWEYENEWRCVRLANEPLSRERQFLQFDDKHLCKIVLGSEISHSDRQKLIDIARQKYLCLVYQSKIDRFYSRLSYKFLPLNKDYSKEFDWYKIDNELPKNFPTFLDQNDEEQN